MDSLLSLMHGSWSRRLASLEKIPLDIMYLVADHSDVEDLLALRASSKPLQDLLSDPGIWRKLYRKSTLFLPPGPYDWQSTSHLINSLSRAEKFHFVWPSSWSCPRIEPTDSVYVSHDATFSVLLGRWLLVAAKSTLVCYDSRYKFADASARTLFDGGPSRHILRVFSFGSVREHGILAFIVLLFKDSFAIAKVLMERGKPSEMQIIFTSPPIAAKRWTDSATVQMYHRILVVNTAGYSSDWKLPGRLMIMDIDALHQYHIPASTDDMVSTRAEVFFFATKTHLVKVVESEPAYNLRSKVECFPIPATHETPERHILYPSHHGQVDCSIQLREWTMILESPMDLETGKISFALCGLTRSHALEVIEVCIGPNGSASSARFKLTAETMMSICIGSSKQQAWGVMLRMDEYPFVFALNYQGPGSFSYRYSMLQYKFFSSYLLTLDTFGGTAFFAYRMGLYYPRVDIVDFAHRVWDARGCLREKIYLDGRIQYQ